MTNTYPSNTPHTPITAILTFLSNTFPDTFKMRERSRRPLKIGIHHDLLSAFGGAITEQELSAALHRYCGCPSYLEHCVDGVGRVDLSGNISGIVNGKEAEWAGAKLTKIRKIKERQQERSKKKQPPQKKPPPKKRPQVPSHQHGTKGDGLAALRLAGAKKRAVVS